jgi:hypothetical protein
MLSINNIVYPTHDDWLRRIHSNRRWAGFGAERLRTPEQQSARSCAKGVVSLESRRARLDNMIRRPLAIGRTKDEALSLGATVLDRDLYGWE